MAITFGPLIAGPYTALYNAVDVGFTLDGFRYGTSWKAEMVNQTDIFGETLIDMVYRGGDAQLSYRSKTYKPGAVTPFWPWGSLGVLATAAAPISRLARDVSKALILTAVANTPAAITPATLTSSKAILAPNVNQELLFDSKVRDVPAVLQLLPYEGAADTLIHLSTT